MLARLSYLQAAKQHWRQLVKLFMVSGVATVRQCDTGASKVNLNLQICRKSRQGDPTVSAIMEANSKACDGCSITLSFWISNSTKIGWCPGPPGPWKKVCVSQVIIGVSCATQRNSSSLKWFLRVFFVWQICCLRWHAVTPLGAPPSIVVWG